MEAIEDYYKSKGIDASGYAPPSDDPNYGMVSIYFGNDFSDKFSYMLKIYYYLRQLKVRFWGMIQFSLLWNPFAI